MLLGSPARVAVWPWSGRKEPLLLAGGSVLLLDRRGGARGRTSRKGMLVGLMGKTRKEEAASVGWWIGVDPDGDLGDECGGGGRDKSLDFRVCSK